MTLEKSRLLGALLPCVLVLGGCAEENFVPPLFNAVDRSISCPSGQVGWDFSTGGFDDEVQNSQRSNELRVLEATYGSACSAVSPGNWTERFASSCNGNVQCTRKVKDPALDPAPGCSKDFRIRYSCGVDPQMYELYYPGEAAEQTIDLRCGDVINIARASYGKNCQPALAGNLTSKLSDLCSGSRRCIGRSGVELFGSDPAPNCSKQTEVVYVCGNEREERTATFNEYVPLDFQCPPRPLVAASSATIGITKASYGSNCGGNNGGNATEHFKRSCDGQTSCSPRVWPTSSPDPAPNCAKDFVVGFTCGPGTPVEFYRINGEAGAATPNLKCGEPMQIVSASYGRNVGAPQNNFLARAQSACDGHRFCDFGPGTGFQLFGNDPVPGRQKVFEFSYLCGSDSALKSVTFAENERVTIACAPGAARAVFATGIRIVSATSGANCADAGQGALRNNALSQVTTTCFGRDLCNYVNTGVVPDPAPGCRKDLDVTYRCGESPEVVSARLAADAGTTLRLSCEPAIKVLSATFGQSCSVPDNNVLTPFRESCHGKRGACSVQIGSVGDPAPSCPKNFSATYSCGADPAIKRINFAADATNSTAAFSCPQPSVPYQRKQCVPERCYGRQRRNSDLQCVADLTKPIVPPFRSVSLSVVDAITRAPATTLKENTAYDLAVVTVHSDRLAPEIFPAGQQVASAVVWAYDTFTPRAGGGAPVQGFRCLIANVGMRRPRVGDPVTGAAVNSNLDRVFVGNVANTMIPSACYGQNISSWRDAAKRLGMNEALFRTQYTDSGLTRVRLSFDHEGRTVALRTDGTQAATALVPNEVGFFYDAPKLWVDFISYYRQTDTLPLSDELPKMAFADSTNIALVARRAVVSNPRLKISLTDSFLLPEMEVDFSWALQGDAPGRNPFSMTAQPLVSSINTLKQRNLGGTIEITLKSLYDSRASGAAWVSRANSMYVGALQGTRLKDGVASGKTDRLVGEFSDALRDRLLLIRTTTNNGWMLSATNVSTEFKVRVCIDMDGMTRGESDASTPLTAQRGTISYAAGFEQPSHRCVVADQTIIVDRELTMKPFNETRAVNTSQVGKSSNQGDSTVATANDNGGQNSCQRQCTADADCGAGNTCSRGPSLGRADGGTPELGVCSGDAATSSCSSLQRQSMGSGGSMGQSQFWMTAGTNSTRTATTTGGRSRTSAELLGFKVLDSTSGTGQASDDRPVSFGWQRFSTSLVPNFALIEAAFRGQELIPKPVKTRFRRVAKSPENGIRREGLSIAVGFDLYLQLGPVPVVLEFSAGVGIGFGLMLSVETNKEQQGDSTSPLYPCWGTQKCLELSTTSATLINARKACLDKGARLAEFPTNATFASLSTAISQASGVATNEEYWVGAQLAYGYNDPACWRFFTRPAQMPASCAQNSTTRYQWMSDGRAIAEQSNLGSTLLNTANYTANFGGTMAALTPLRTSVPRLAGVAWVRGSNTLVTRESNAATTKRYVCEFEPARSYDATKIGVTASIEASAGFSFAACTPSNVAGFCIAANLRLIFAEVALGYEYSNINLFTQAGSLMSTRQNHTILGTWKWGFLSGAISAQLRFIFFNLEWDIVKFEGLQSLLTRSDPSLADKFAGTLFKVEWPSKKDYP